MAARRTPVTERVMTGSTDLGSVHALADALEALHRGDLYISKAVIRVENGHGYPVGHLIKEINDEEFNFVAWDDQHDS